MFGCLDFGPDFTNNPIFIDEKCLAVDAHVRLAVVVLLFPHAIQLRNSRIGIGKQWILQPILVGKFLMGSNVVSAHTEHNNPTLLHNMIGIAERASFGCTAGGVVFYNIIASYGWKCEIRSRF